MRSRFFGAVAVKAVAVLCLALLPGTAMASGADRAPLGEPDPAFRAPSPLISGGFRFQTVDRGERPDRFLVGVNLLMLKTLSGDQGAFWAFLSPGVHYQFQGDQQQGDRRVVVSLAPVTYVGDSGLSLSLLVFPVGSGREGGVFGASVGFHYF